MKKETVLKFLSCSCFLLPGNIKCRKVWFLSVISFLSMLTLILVLLAVIGELIGYQKFIPDENLRNTVMTLKHLPARPIGVCLKPLEKNTTLIEVEVKNNVFVQKVAVGSEHQHGNGTNKTSQAAPRHPMSDLEDIVSTAYRFIVSGTNIAIRIFLWFIFPSLIDQFTNLFFPLTDIPEKQKVASGDNLAKSNLMTPRWYEASQTWNTEEKVFLLTIGLSLLQREVLFFYQFYVSISNTGLELLSIPCVLLQVVTEQIKVILAGETVTEVVAFFLIVIMKTFTKVIAQIAGGEGDEDNGLEYNDAANIVGFFRDEIGNAKHLATQQAKLKRQNSDALFVKTRDMLSTSDYHNSGTGIRKPRGIQTIDEQISDIIGGYYGDPGLEAEHKKRSNLYIYESVAATTVYSQIDFVISIYFYLMEVWEKASTFTGFVTLALFCELTTTFCFNTYITLDITMKFGLFSGFGATGLARGIVIISKLVCICNAAQALRDMVLTICLLYTASYFYDF